ncbi:hypothetical protein B0T20DRAFT_365575 [Sordaria brevicollis]|uniref:Uncharacterized protein n=1 Tax=Sordaria brevicollis TaxID=83679 RepID=A0AAE0NUV3_SORBR|nr:hypothetical protein B0T20DRAFT_365575 [Sordaria brevicollis]
MRDDDLIDRLLAQLPAPYPLATGRSGNGTSLPSVRRERTEPGEIAPSPTAHSPPLNAGQEGLLPARPAPRQVDIVREPSGIRNPLSPIVHSRVPAGPQPAPGTPQDRFKNAVLANPLVRSTASVAPGSWGGSQQVFGNTFFSRHQEHERDVAHEGFGGLQALGKANTKVAPVAVAKPSTGSSVRADAPAPQTRNTTANRPSTNNPVGNVPKGPKKNQPQVSSAPVPSGRGSIDGSARQKLSFKCQSRGFNLEWVSNGTSGKKCSYNVKIQDVIIKSDGWYADAQTAKAAVATKALKDARLWSKWEVKRVIPSNPSTTNHGNGSSATSTNTSRQKSSRQNTTSGQNTTSARRESGSSGSGVNRTVDETERLKLLVMLQRYIGPAVPNYTGRPDVCNAFFEGLAMGAGLTRPSQSSPRQTLTDRARSRSPPTRPSRSSAHYRTRSPLGARLRLTPPPMYEHYSGRPNSSHYRPGDTPRREPPRGPASMLRGNTVVKKE